MLGTSERSVSAVGVEESVPAVGSTGPGSGGSAPGAGAEVEEAEGAVLGGHGGTLVLRSDLDRSDADDGAAGGGGAPPDLGSMDDPGLPSRGLLREDRDLELSDAGGGAVGGPFGIAMRFGSGYGGPSGP